MKRGIFRKLFPDNLWSGRFLYWWIVALLTILMFDLFWMGETTFRPFGDFAFWAYLLLATTILAFPALFSSRGWGNFILLLIADLIMIANLMYCQTYLNAIPAQSYFLAGNLRDFGPSVADSFRWYFIFLPVLSVAAIIIYLLLIPRRDKKRLPSLLSYFCTLAVLCILAWGADAWRGGTMERMSFLRSSAYAHSSVPAIYTIPGFVIHDYLKSNEKLSPEEEKEVEQWLCEHEKIIENSGLDSVAGERDNLIVILCESLESWPLEKKIEGKELTPFLNSLLSDSTTFYAPDVVTQVGDGRSIEGQLLILSGMLPMRHGVYAYEADGNKFFTLPDAIKKEGGRTYLVTSDKPYVWNQTGVAKAFNIDTIINAADFINNEPAGGARRLSDGGLMRQSVEKLKNGEFWPEGERAFLMWVTYSGHNPFRIPENLKRIKFKGDYPEIIRNYMETVNYTDYALSILVDYLKSRSDWDSTMVVITGDHEGLAVNRQIAANNEKTREFVDPLPHTPLIILNSPKGGRYEGEMGQVDIYSTIAGLMDLKDYPWKGLGFSVVSPGFPGIAVGSSDEIEGDTAQISPAIMNHIKKARDISDRIIRFDLLKNLKNIK